jgi:hypothetical protein
MTIQKLVAGTSVADPLASTGTQVAAAVNGLIDVNEEINNKQNLVKDSPLWADATDNGFTVTDVLGTAAIEYNSTAPNGRRGVKCTITSASRIRINSLTGQQFAGELFAEIYGTRTLTNCDGFQIEAYEVTGGGEKGWRFVRGTIASPLDNSVEQGGQTNYHGGAHTPLTAFGTSPSAMFKVAQFSIRVQPFSGTATFWIFGAGLVAPKRKSRIAVVFDDGWKACATLGASPLLSRGLPFTVAVIPTAVDQALSEYMSLVQLKSLLNAGCGIIAHGPIGGDPAGSLIENFTNTADRIADIQSVIQWIRDKGLATPKFDSCYIWPRGKFQAAINDTSLLDAALGIGVTNARSTQNVSSSVFRGSYGSQSPYGRQAMPIIGHEAANTLALEPANITEIINKINTLSDAGGVDMHLMLHKVIRREDATDGNRSITIMLDDLDSIAAAIKAKIDAGKLECVLMQDFEG